MRRAQLRLRQLGTIVAIAIFVAAATIASAPSRHPAIAGAAAAAQVSSSGHREPGGIRWRVKI